MRMPLLQPGPEASALPRRQLLSVQTAAVIEAGIRSGRWTRELPGQHELCRQLVVSRKTLRVALQALHHRGLVTLRQGLPTAVRPARGRATAARGVRRVLLLLPEPLWRLRPSVGRWVSELRPRLLEAGLGLELVEGGRAYGARPESALTHLAHTHPRSAWVAFAGTLALQCWLHASGHPAVIVGSVFPGLELASIEYDHAAIARHAAARLRALGHERTAILLRRTGSAADATTCAAFAAGLGEGAPAPVLLAHEAGMPNIARQVARLTALRPRPTALFVTKTLAVPAAYTLLSSAGLAVPRDLALVCREDDPFLDYLAPSVARYGTDPAAIARKLAVLLGRIAAGESLRITHDLLQPRFIPGGSLAPPFGRGGGA
ncbi:MAG: GntR family transcriptional regulator [Verrucomicrobia bacterium]|nr:GntR family transcriptional regulator [Verrucomicrobiota bacterium]